MDGVFLVRALLLARPALITLVGVAGDKPPADRIGGSVRPEGTPLPAIALTHVSGTDRHTLAGGPSAKIKVTDRVQITVMAKTYPELKRLMAEVRYACRNFVGTIGGVSGVTSHLDGTGPDFPSETGIETQTQDVRITFDDTAPS